MRIKTYVIDSTTGEQYEEGECDLADALDPETEDYAEALLELQGSGRAWVGGGAAPMFLLMRS